MSREVLARHLGRQFGCSANLAEELTDCQDRNLAGDILHVSIVLCTLKGNAYFEYVHGQVWSSLTRTVFFLQQPLEHALMDIAAAPEKACEHDTLCFRFLCEALDAQASAARIACGLAVPLAKISSRVKRLACYCNVLRRMFEDPAARPLMLVPELFEGLATRVKEDACIVETLAVLSDNIMLAPVADACATVLVCDVLGQHVTPPSPMLRFLEECAKGAQLRQRLVPRVVAMKRHGWPPAMGVLVGRMLSDTSIEFVLRLHEEHGLPLLIRCAHTNASWNAARDGLCRHWPGKVAEVLNRVEPTRDPTNYECPITLVACTRPVVASDGHVYERDALVQHMATNGMWSPLTKETLAHHVYDIRCAHS